MGGAALEEGKFNAPDLGPGLPLDGFRQHGAQSAQLRMAEDVPVPGFRDKAAVRILHPFRDGDHAAPVTLVNPVHILPEFFHAEGDFRQVNQVRSGARISGHLRGRPHRPAIRRDGP